MTRLDRRRRTDDGGFVLTWMALMIVVLMGFAGFSVDVGNWYFTASKLQRAADAGALAGAVYLPGNIPGSKTIAAQAVTDNGYTNGVDTATVSADQTNLQPTQLRVTVATTVKNSFAQLLGVNTTKITRSAVGEFQGPIPMGSPDNRVCNDPDNSYNQGCWINVDGPNSNKQNGDEFATYNCNTGESNCSGNIVGGNAPVPDSNPPVGEFNDQGYAFAIEVPSTSSATPFNVQVFDAELGYTGDNCLSSDGTVVYPVNPTDVNALQAISTAWVPAGYYSNAATRYDGTGASAYCVGDTTTNANASNTAALSANLGTTFIVRKPDQTPFDDFDNPIATDDSGNACVMQTRTYDLRNSAASRIMQYLTPGDGQFNDSEALVDSSDNFSFSTAGGGTTGVSFAESFRRWLSVCKISSPTSGDYILQVKTDTDLGVPNTANSAGSVDKTLSGKNRMAFRAGFASGTNTPSGANFKVYGNGKLPLYANAPGASSNFYLARVLPSGSARTLQVKMFDMGDASSSGTLTLVYDPDGDGTTSSYTPPGGCDFVRDFSTTVNSANCQLSGVSASAGYNGRITQINVPIPASYTCDDTVDKGCWFLINASFPGATSVQDTTTWTASIQGDPVHLIK